MKVPQDARNDHDQLLAKLQSALLRERTATMKSIQAVERLYFQEHGTMPESTPELSRIKKFKTTNQLPRNGENYLFVWFKLCPLFLEGENMYAQIITVQERVT